jgi:dihydrofolate reductase
MRKLIVAAFLSLDGVMQAPGGPDEDTSGGFRFGGWTVPHSDNDSGEVVMDWFSQPFELLLGRRTYDIFAGYWPHQKEEGNTIAQIFNRIPKHVVTHQSDGLMWNNSHAISGDMEGAIRTLKHEHGANLLTQGSSELVHQLLLAGLVDELRLMIFPVVLGHGKRLFGENAEAAAFTLAESKVTSRGVIITRFVKTGDVETGSF